MKRVVVSPDREIEVDIDPGAAAPAALEAGTAVVLRDGVVYRVTAGESRLLVNGKEVQLVLADPRDRRRGQQAKALSGQRDVRAAMPGRVVRVLAEAGQMVEPGTGLLILEAMKMQNEVRSPGAGRVAALRVSVGDTVASGQVLVTLE
jgi:biotin carboxyl carrier protein